MQNISWLAAIACLAAAPAAAQSCDVVRLADVGWTDNMAQNGIAANVLNALGYETEITLLSLPITFESLANNDIDVFLDQWLPSMEGMIAPYVQAGTIDVIGPTLEGAKYTLATNTAGAALGIADFADVVQHADVLESQMFGVEPGNDGNTLILDVMAKNEFGFGAFTLVETSEQAMLAEVTRLTEDGTPAVWLAWEPHPMNVDLDITYLTGGDAYFGPNFGGATVYTNTRAGYVAECPNTGKLLTNMKFTLQMENEIMGAILNAGADPRDAAKAWLAANPTAWEGWFDGVTTKDGGDARAAVTAALQ